MRNRIAGIYIKNNQILLVKHRKNNKEYYLLPGGGQDEKESMIDSLKREWKEELNLDIKVEELLFVGESIPLDEEKKKHIIQFVFEVSEIKGEIKVGADGVLFGYEFVDVDKLDKITLYPDCYSQIDDFIKNTNTINKNLNYLNYKWRS